MTNIADHDFSGHGETNPSPQKRLAKQNIEQRQLDHTDRLARIETKIENIEKAVSDIKSDVKENNERIQENINSLNATVNKVIGGGAVIKWFVGIGVVGYIFNEIILPLFQ